MVAMACASVCSASQAPWRPSVPRVGRQRPRQARVCAQRAASILTEQDLMQAVQGLGYPAAIFPGDEQARAGIDASIGELEAANPTPSPLRQRGGQPAPELLGDWKLIYASSGTYVTRTAAAQALLAASKLPGVGVSDVRQGLELGSSAGAAGTAASSGKGSSGGGSDDGGVLRTSNAAAFGLGPFGDWEVVIRGTWAVRDGCLARVSFDGFTLQLVGLLGLIKLPSMAKVRVPVTNSITADFNTTYLSPTLRVARGRAGNIFLFSKL